MRPKTLALLTLVVAALAAFIYFHERRLPSSEERRERAGRLVTLEANEVTALELEWQGARTRFERPAGQPASAWRLVEPLAARADGVAVERLLGDLARLAVSRTLEGTERSEVGLEPPRGRIAWEGEGGAGAIEVGGQVPASRNVVVAATGRTGLLVVPGHFVAELERPAGDWRTREVVAVGREAIERITLLPAGGEAVVLARRSDGFAVEAPFADAADRDRVESLLGDLVSLRVGRFVDPPVPESIERTLAASAGAIELGLAAGEPVLRLDLGGEVTPGGDRVLRAGETVFEARTALASALARTPAEWRSTSWTSFESYRVERIRIEDREGALELTRSGADWQRDGVPIAYPEVGDLLYALTSARAERVVPLVVGAPVAAPTLTVTLLDGDGAEQILTLHPGGLDGVPARRSGREAELLLPGRMADEISARIAALRAARALGAEVTETRPAETAAGEPEE